MLEVQIGKRIAYFRKECGFTQAELAKKLEVDSSYISKIESGYQEPSFRFLKRIAKALSVSLSSLVAADRESTRVPAQTEAADLLAKFRQLTDEDKKSMGDFFRFLIERQHKREKHSEVTK